MLLTSYLSWVWRCMVSAFHCAEEWTSSGDTWEGMQSGPVGSKCSESGRKTACRKWTKTSNWLPPHQFQTNGRGVETTRVGSLGQLKVLVSQLEKWQNERRYWQHVWSILLNGKWHFSCLSRRFSSQTVKLTPQPVSARDKELDYAIMFKYIVTCQGLCTTDTWWYLALDQHKSYQNSKMYMCKCHNADF